MSAAIVNVGAYRGAHADRRRGGAVSGTLGDHDTIRFDSGLSGQTIFLSAGLGAFQLDQSVTIAGDDAPGLAIDGGNQVGVFQTTINSSLDIAISNLTVSGGFASLGGAVYTYANLTLVNCIVRNNIAQAGGGIFNGGNLTLLGTTVANNAATLLADSGNGGGIDNEGTLIIDSSQFTGNNANGTGGAIYASKGHGTNVLSITDSVLSGNSAAWEAARSIP